MRKEDNLKTNSVGVRFTSSEYHNLNLSAVNSGMNDSEYVRQAVQEKLERENPEVLKKRKKELKEELERIEKQEQILKQKKEEKINIPEKELIFLVETKEIIDERPQYLDGRIKLFLNTFAKPYNISRKEFLELLEKAQIQFENKQSEIHIAQDLGIKQK